MRRQRNKKVKKNATFKTGSMGASALLVTGVMMLMGFYVLDSRCNAITREIGKHEKRYASLEAECVRESVRWESLKVQNKLEEKLSRFGLEMRPARQDQIVRMTADGRPAVGQISVARAKARMRASEIARR